MMMKKTLLMKHLDATRKAIAPTRTLQAILLA
jgi:hypothetical protein